MQKLKQHYESHSYYLFIFVTNTTIFLAIIIKMYIEIYNAKYILFFIFELLNHPSKRNKRFIPFIVNFPEWDF